jgi:hypothetical protein
MKVGDIVFALLGSGKPWPGKVQHLGVVVEVKLFRVKLPQKIPAKDV